MGYKYSTNAFWEAEDRSILKCIRLTPFPDQPNKTKKEVMTFRKILADGSECPNYREVVEQLGVMTIDKNTAERIERKQREEKEKRAVHEQKKKTAELEHLFKLKLKAFEIDEIKNSKDRTLRSKIRRAKSEVEMNALTTILMAKEMGLIHDGSDAGTE